MESFIHDLNVFLTGSLILFSIALIAKFLFKAYRRASYQLRREKNEEIERMIHWAIEEREASKKGRKK